MPVLSHFVLRVRVGMGGTGRCAEEGGTESRMATSPFGGSGPGVTGGFVLCCGGAAITRSSIARSMKAVNVGYRRFRRSDHRTKPRHL